MKILVLSSHTQPGLTAPINHQIYCAKHGYDYLFDATPYPIQSIYDQKIKAVSCNLPHCDWLLWIDHDAYFMNHGIRLESFIEAYEKHDMIFCKSPVNARTSEWTTEWTLLNSGVFLVRNSSQNQILIEQMLNTDLQMVEEWWDKDKYGAFTKGDQDRIVYQLAIQNLLNSKVKILEHSAFNARPRDFQDRADEHFVVHFCGFQRKIAAIEQFRKKFRLNRFLVPEAVAIENFQWSVFFSALQPERKMSWVRRALRKARASSRK